MPGSVTLPYGEWPSPITADALAAGARSFEQIAIDGADICWVEVRPDEKGRYVVMRWSPASRVEEVTPPGYSARTLVNSYGGGSMAVRERLTCFVNFAAADHPDTKDQRLYRQAPGLLPVPLTSPRNARYADCAIDARRGLLYCVMEDSGAERHGQPVQTIVALDLEGRKLPLTIAEGTDFYASPRLSPDGRRLCWISWDYPSMPWDGTALYVAELDAAGRPAVVRQIAGAPADGIDPALNPVLQEALRFSGESIVDPKWAPDGTLFFVSDRFAANGDRWWNIHRLAGDVIEPVTRKAAEFAAPPWRLGGSSYGFVSRNELLCCYTEGGRWTLARVAVDTGRIIEIDTPFSEIAHLHVGNGFAAFVGASFTRPPAIVRYDLATRTCEELRSANPNLSPEALACFAAPEAIAFATGRERAERAYAFYYAPNNPAARGPEGAKPPLLIFVHGGPTAAAGASVSLSIQFFTSRGFAVVDVNYRGSTGFGRAFRQRMYGSWGIVDVEDCVQAAKTLIERGDVDRYRVASRGGSSGGYTTLALATFTDLLTSAASYYGISDLEMIARETDKLEARYAELLVGPYPLAQKEFKARSPLHHASRIGCPLALFQGLDDPVVPPKQAQVLIDDLMARKLPVAYEFYPGESHGFRIKANIVRSLEEELAFYGEIMGFFPAGRLARPVIHNWPPAGA
ncbi:MAG: prolyl oligopeptidase family serine peptidase [Burkholderiales bacterium]|nr:prolyl oligopeptidase family serine peptidase [Burkholderiales bacterium]